MLKQYLLITLLFTYAYPANANDVCGPLESESKWFKDKSNKKLAEIKSYHTYLAARRACLQKEFTDKEKLIVGIREKKKFILEQFTNRINKRAISESEQSKQAFLKKGQHLIQFQELVARYRIRILNLNKQLSGYKNLFFLRYKGPLSAKESEKSLLSQIKGLKNKALTGNFSDLASATAELSHILYNEEIYHRDYSQQAMSLQRKFITLNRELILAFQPFKTVVLRHNINQPTLEPSIRTLEKIIHYCDQRLQNSKTGITKLVRALNHRGDLLVANKTKRDIRKRDAALFRIDAETEFSKKMFNFVKAIDQLPAQIKIAGIDFPSYQQKIESVHKFLSYAGVCDPAIHQIRPWMEVGCKVFQEEKQRVDRWLSAIPLSLRGYVFILKDQSTKIPNALFSEISEHLGNKRVYQAIDTYELALRIGQAQ